MASLFRYPLTLGETPASGGTEGNQHIITFIAFISMGIPADGKIAGVTYFDYME